MDAQVERHYRRIVDEHSSISRNVALHWAREAVEVDALEREAEWSDDGELCTLSDGVVVAAQLDEDPDVSYLAEEELQSDVREWLGILVRAEEGGPILDSLWGVEILSHWSGDRVRREILATAHAHGMIETARREIAEREAMACRGVVTIDA